MQPSARFVSLLMMLSACGDDAGGSPFGLGGVCEGDAALQTGEGTYYAADGTGNCSFDPIPGDPMVAALNTTDYADAAMCGACVEATGPNGTVTVRIVDRCPECKQGDLDFSQNAFVKLAPLSAGRVRITWKVVPCEVEGPLSYRFKEGSSEFWTGIQVRNHPLPLTKLELRLEDGSYREVPRESYNYFVDTEGFGKGPFHLRMTDADGRVVEDDDVKLADGQVVRGNTQFPQCE